MTVITLRLTDSLLKEVNGYARVAHLPRSEYIREAIVRMNKEMLARERKKRLQSASLKVRKESLRINNEFDRIEHDPKD